MKTKTSIALICGALFSFFLVQESFSQIVENPITGTKDYRITGGTGSNASPSFIRIGGVNTAGVGGTISLSPGDGMGTKGDINLTIPSTGNINCMVKDGLFRIGYNGGSYPFTINYQGNVNTTGTISAASFLDKNNTVYYLDPSNTATALKIAGNIENGSGNGFTWTGGGSGNNLNVKLYGVGGIKNAATFSYDNGIILNALGSAPSLSFNINGSTYMFMSSVGNVGIGCSNPTEKLVVNGKTVTTELEVRTTPCSDFVFEPDYKLKSIAEVEQFVKSNKHLPDVPSANDFKEKGYYNLSEMDNLLLQKVEELTLYVIELKKENENLNQKMNTLQSKL